MGSAARVGGHGVDLIGVVVPAANEQARIGGCLEALVDAREHVLAADARVGVRIVVVLDCCVDATAAAVGRHPGVEAVRCHAGQVGAARALGVRRLLAGCRAPWERIWLANTDADSRVPRDWMTTMLSHARGGAQLVLGTVWPDDELDARHRQAWLARHRLRDGHRHVHGANFGIRADTYEVLGGWPPVDVGEDVMLARRAGGTAGVPIARTAAIPVTTSSRLMGRTPDGFAGYLRALVPHASVGAGAPVAELSR